MLVYSNRRPTKLEYIGRYNPNTPSNMGNLVRMTKVVCQKYLTSINYFLKCCNSEKCSICFFSEITNKRDYKQASTYEACDPMYMPPHMPKTLEIC